ncbi:hypothetical protein [Nonomuraea fuscirosea]|uniref:hypothetical protein n=1 Tax=Nonomuraea fuscirosea TaxID=1291556 RepID=UPI003448A61B
MPTAERDDRRPEPTVPRRAHTPVANLPLFLPLFLPPTRVTHAAAPLLPPAHTGHHLTIRTPAVRTPAVRTPAVLASAHPSHSTPRRLTIDHATIGSPAQRHSAAGPFTGQATTIGGPSAQDAAAGCRTAGHTTVRDPTIQHLTRESPAVWSPMVHATMARNTKIRDATVGHFTIEWSATGHVFTRPANHPRRTLMTAPVQAQAQPQTGARVPYRIRQSGFDVVIGHSRPTSR